MSDSDCINCDIPIINCQCGNTESFSDVSPVCPYCGSKEIPHNYNADTTLRCKCSSCERIYSLDVFSITDNYQLTTWTGTQIYE